MSVTIRDLQAASNPLPLQTLFYTDGCESHLDLGSNDGRTLRGLDHSRITCVELFVPSVEKLQAQGFAGVIGDDLRAVVVAMTRRGQHFDRVTCFDVIEHLPREDGERLIEQVEQIARREVVFFVPVETDEPACQEYMAWAMRQVSEGQRDLQTHRSRWTPGDFDARGYVTLLLPNFHCPGFGAFFAAKYKRPEDQAAVVERLRAYVAEYRRQQQAKLSNWRHFGQNSRVDQPLFVGGAEHMAIGDGVSIGYGARLECVTTYGGETYAPTLVIGDGTTAEFHLHIGCAERVVIGRDCIIAGHVLITDHDHGFDLMRPLHGQPLTVAPVEIGDHVFVGEFAAILKGVHVGDHAVIGAHSVVTRDVPAGAVVAGAPARELHLRTILPHAPLVSIVVPTVEPASERLARCKASVRANTPGPTELIVVHDERRRGFAATCNLGIAQAKGDFVLLLNDDTIVAEGWLSRMLDVMDAFPDVGLVGPVSDNVSGPQRREPLPGPISQESSRLVGFCLLIRRAVVEKIGGFDERYPANYEDDDYCLRAAAAGFKARIALDSFVHHEGQATFRAIGADFAAAMEAGWQVFRAKWGAEKVDGGYRVKVPEWDVEKCYCKLPEVSA